MSSECDILTATRIGVWSAVPLYDGTFYCPAVVLGSIRMAKTAQGAEAAEKETESSSAEAMLEMILMKEDEIKLRIQRAENESQRLVEEAKLDAAHKKREAVAGDIGLDLREKELEKAKVEAEKVAQEVWAQVE